MKSFEGDSAMKYNRFEELPVWQDATNLSVMIFQLTDDKSFRFRGDIANQLQRAALSVSNNIAEGFERGTTAELITFLYYSRGSSGEVRSILNVCERLDYFNHLKSEISDPKSKAESVSRQLRAWANSIQDSDIRGEKHLNTKEKNRYARQKRADAFMEKIEKINEETTQRRKHERKMA